MTPAELRDEIPVTNSITYFNSGASGPSPRRVVNAVVNCLEHLEYVAPADVGMLAYAEDTIDVTRNAVAGFFNATPAEIALTQSTTDGINLIANAIDWEPGDTVVRTDIEHASGILPWDRLRDTHGINIEVIETENGWMSPDEFEPVLREAKLVCLSSIAWNYGTKLPVKSITEIAHEHGAQVLVDAAQSPGQRAVDLHEWGADFVAGTGHKWLLGPMGGGFLYVSEAALPDLRPNRIGWRSVIDSNAETYDYRDEAMLFEVSTLPVAVFRGLTEAIEVMSDVGLAAIESRIERLATRLKDGIPSDRLVSPPAFESGLVSFTVADSEEFVQRAREEGIVIRSIPYPDCVRVSVHAYNTVEEIDHLLSLIR